MSSYFGEQELIVKDHNVGYITITIRWHDINIYWHNYAKVNHINHINTIHTKSYCSSNHVNHIASYWIILNHSNSYRIIWNPHFCQVPPVLLASRRSFWPSPRREVRATWSATNQYRLFFLVCMAFEGIGIRNNDLSGKVVSWSTKTVI